jgi:hypothetical protein
MKPMNMSQGGTILNQSDPLPILEFPDDMVCCNIKKFQLELQAETEYIDYLLSELRHYYDTMKTKTSIKS